jgi:hypothetical protein
LSWSSSCPDNTSKTVIFFVNGILTLESDAIIYKSILEKKFKEFIYTTSPSSPKLNSECLEFDYAYNQTLGLLEDIYESWVQKANEEPSSFWSYLLSIFSPSESSARVVAEEITQINPTSYVIRSDLNKHLNQYRAEFPENHVVVVSHSQGNFYTNQSYDELSQAEKDIFRIVAVATPSNFVNGYVPGSEPYTTLEEDKIINSVRELFPSTLSPNTSNGILNVEPNGHAFLVLGRI